MQLKKKINAFVELGKLLSVLSDKNTKSFKSSIEQQLIEQINYAHLYNPWFTKENMRHALSSLGKMLNADTLNNWIDSYRIDDAKTPKNIGVIMAGNIPLVGFHDFLCVLLSGNKITAKLSSNDRFLLPIIANFLIDYDSDFKDLLDITEKTVKNADAYIATGSDNSARYFEYYFGKYPHIIRKNRNSIAIIKGDETTTDFDKLADDVFLYFGLGCRNVTKLFIKKDFEFAKLFNAFEKYRNLINHHKYANNYEYFKAVFLVNKEAHLDNGFLLLRESTENASPVAVMHYEYYENKETLKTLITANSESFQCIVGSSSFSDNAIGFGETQQPKINDYADNIDTMKFLLSL